MKMTKDFVSGFASAVANLGQEGDDRGTDWSAPYEYLKGRLATFEPLEGLVDHLRHFGGLYGQAADEIERLSAKWIAETRENERLRSALQRIADRPKDMPLRTRNDYEAGEKVAVEWAADIATDALEPAAEHTRGTG